MPRYFFHLRDGGSGVIDRDGIDLPDDASARENAATVARELMHRIEAKTRHWQLDVADEAGRACFCLPFWTVDDTIKHLPDLIRWQFEQLCVRQRELADAVQEARLTSLQSRALVARARGKPHLVSHRFGQQL